MNEATATAIPVTLFFDYNCPFCYVASHRLERLGQRHALEILWRFLEIHPENPAKGKPLSELDYPPQQWRQMCAQLQGMLEEEGLPWGGRTFTTNTRKAILLAQLVLLMHPGRFMALHHALFHAYFADCRNIGDETVLRELAREHGVEDAMRVAWDTPKAMKVLLSHVEAAQELELTGVPTLVVAGRPFTGAASMDILDQALRERA